MNEPGGSYKRGSAVVAAVVFAAFSWTLLLSASPLLHQRVHPDANPVDHSCAVTLVASGSYEHAGQALLNSAAELIFQYGTVQALISAWVTPLFFKAHIFAHAPPAPES